MWSTCCEWGVYVKHVWKCLLTVRCYEDVSCVFVYNCKCVSWTLSIHSTPSPSCFEFQEPPWNNYSHRLLYHLAFGLVWPVRVSRRKEGGRDMRLEYLFLQLPFCQVMVNWAHPSTKGQSPSRSTLACSSLLRLSGRALSPSSLWRRVVTVPSCC